MRKNRTSGALAVIAVIAFSAVTAYAVNEPQLVSTDPSANSARRSSTVSQVSATYDRSLDDPPKSTFELRDKNHGNVAGHVVTTGGPGPTQETIIFRPDALLSETLSPYTAHVVAYPATGDPTTSQWTFAIDDTPPPSPSISSPPENSNLKNMSVSLAGNAAANALVTVSESGTTLGTATANGTGAWALNRNFADGAHTIVATQNDPAGNTSAPSPGRNFKIDTHAPAAPAITSPEEGAQLTTDAVAVAGTAEAGTTVNVKEGGGTIGTATANASGDWSISRSFSNGAHTINAIATDAAGNVSPASPGRSFSIIDTSAPAAPAITTPVEGARLTIADVPISGSSEPGASIDIKESATKLATATTGDDGHWTATPHLADGAHTITAIATDAAGNVSPASATRSFIVDTTPPAAPTIITPASGEFVPSAAVSIGGRAEAATIIRIREGTTVIDTTTTDATGIWSLAHTFADGDHAITATATDPFGGTSVASGERAFTVHAAPPGTPVIEHPATGEWVNASSSFFSGTGQPNTTITLMEGAKTVATASVNTGGRWVQTFTLSDGAHAITATATDRAGRASPATAARTFSVDTVAPSGEVTSQDPSIFLPGATEILGTAHDNVGVHSVTVEFRQLTGAIAQSIEADVTNADRPDVTWRAVPTAVLPGIYMVRATVIDRAGNATMLKAITVVRTL